MNAYTWGRANRLLSMGGASYGYGGLGNQIRQTVGVNMTQYLLDVQPGLLVVLAAATGLGTLVFVMGATFLLQIVARLLEVGVPRDTPALCIEWGTTAQQREAAGTLAELPARVQAAGIGSPALTIIGVVVGLRAGAGLVHAVGRRRYGPARLIAFLRPLKPPYGAIDERADRVHMRRSAGG